MMLVDDKPTTESEIREAKRVACINEAMDIIRTLNSHGITFTVEFNSDIISFQVIGNVTKIQKLIPVIVNHGWIFGYTGIAFSW